MSRRLRAVSGETDILLLIPRDTAGGNIAQRTERAVRWLWSRGIYPGPSAVSLRLHGHANRTINGKETTVRNRLMKELGIARQRRFATAWPCPACKQLAACRCVERDELTEGPPVG